MSRFGSGRKSSGLRVYSNLSSRRKQKADAKARRKAEYLSTLPKNPVQRFFYRMHPRRLAAFWFSREGGIMALKIAGVSLVLLAILIGGLFAYYRHELNAISPEELNKRVQTTVSRYYDRNGTLLWEDKGDGDYKLVVQSNEINKYMKEATVAAEDKDFYNHAGVSVNGIARSFFNNFTGGDTQGGSTLTQQLIKQVFLSDEASKRGLNGIPRKIKEIILAIEVERMYNKDQILTLYLNESPYGGRRNGVESASQTYFGTAAKDLTLPEAALLASIPQEPGLFNPYNVDGHKALLDRQHYVLDSMAQQGYISQQQADDAKKVAVLDTIKPEQPIIAKAPHFIQLVKSQLEKELGAATVGRGGLTIKTTLDYRAQQIVESAMSQLFASNLPRSANFDNGAATVEDVKTGQIIAMQGSRDYNYPGYGQDNAATAFLQPGSSVKPFVYSSLFKQKSGTNYGAGTILSDEPLPPSIYKTDEGDAVSNFNMTYRGNIPIRSGLAESRNIPAIKAMYLNDQASGQGATLQTIHDFGDASYCTNGVEKQAGLSLAIGSCSAIQLEHVNAFSTLARMGVYKPTATVLEVKNSQGQIIKQWKDDQSKQIVDPQITYIIADILSDANARAPSFGGPSVQYGMVIPGVKTGTKTGTSNLGTKSKDLWMNSFSPSVAMSIWVGNHDNRAMSNALSSTVGPTVAKIVTPIHTQIYEKDGRWKPGDWFTRPAGVQTLNVSGKPDLFPSWYQKAQSTDNSTAVAFDSVSKKKATSCTPARAQVSLNVQTVKDPVTQKTTTISPDGYDASADDNVHNCSDVKPFVSVSATPAKNSTITVTVNQGTFPLQSLEVQVNGTVIASQPVSGAGTYTFNYTFPATGAQQVSATITDSALYDASITSTVNVVASNNSPFTTNRNSLTVARSGRR